VPNPVLNIERAMVVVAPPGPPSVKENTKSNCLKELAIARNVQNVMVDIIIGIVTEKKVFILLAPSIVAASISSLGTD
jgi:hypothetical protein